MRGDGDDDEDHDVDRQRELAGFEALVPAHGQRRQPGDQADVPDPHHRHAELFAPHAHAAQPRHQVVAEADEEGGEGAEDHAVDVNRAQPAEGQLQRRRQIIREIEHGRDGHAERGREHQPEHAPVQPDLDQPLIHQSIEIDAGELAAQRLRHGLPSLDAARWSDLPRLFVASQAVSRTRAALPALRPARIASTSGATRAWIAGEVAHFGSSIALHC